MAGKTIWAMATTATKGDAGDQNRVPGAVPTLSRRPSATAKSQPGERHDEHREEELRPVCDRVGITDRRRIGGIFETRHDDDRDEGAETEERGRGARTKAADPPLHVGEDQGEQAAHRGAIDDQRR